MTWSAFCVSQRFNWRKVGLDALFLVVGRAATRRVDFFVVAFDFRFAVVWSLGIGFTATRTFSHVHFR